MFAISRVKHMKNECYIIRVSESMTHAGTHILCGHTDN